LLGASSASWLRGRREPGASLAIAFGTAWFAAPYLLAREWSLASAAAAPVELSALLSPWIHAAGLGFGCSFGLVAPHARRRGRLAARPRAGEGAESLLQLAEQALHAGDRERAFSLLSQRIHESPGDRAAGLSLWQVGRALGRNLDAVAALLRVVRDELRSNMHDECVAHWLELAQVDQPIRVEPALLIALAPLLEARGHRDEALAALESALADRECSSAHAAQIALAAEPLDPELAQRAAWRAQADAAPEPALRREPAARAPAAEAREAAAPSSPTPNSIPSSEPEEAVVDLVEPVAWSPPGSERVQWEDPQLRPEEGTAAGGDLHGAVSLDALQVDVSLASKAPLELPRAPSAPRRDARAARASAAPAPSAEPSPPPRTSRRPDSREKSERALDVLEAIPVELTESALRLEIIGVGKKKLRYAQLQALGAASIRAESGGPLFAIDLVLNWRDARGEPLKVVRLRSDRFDPIALVGDAESAPAAIRQLVALLLERSGASALPDAHSARGLPFREFPSFETYQRDVLMPEL
jgi:tetratricopeptide (TPR) repeat protein